jgi:hypothetical protein
MSAVRHPVVELRQYTLRPGQRDVLIDLFDREFIGFPAAARPPAGHAQAPRSRVLVTLYYRDRPFDQAFADFFDRQARPLLIDAGATPLACLQTEHGENTFPGLPVRTGENVFAWLARFPSPARLDDHLRQIGRSGDWRDRVLPALTALITGAPQQLRLAPTARSLLR